MEYSPIGSLVVKLKFCKNMEKSQNSSKLGPFKISFCCLCFYSQLIFSKTVIFTLEFALYFYKLSYLELEMLVIQNLIVRRGGKEYVRLTLVYM